MASSLQTGRPYSVLGYLTPEGFEQLSQDAQSDGLDKLYRDAGGGRVHAQEHLTTVATMYREMEMGF